MPGYRRQVVIISSNKFNRSNISTVVGVILTPNTHLASAPGNVLLPEKKTGLPNDSVANATQIITVDKAFLTEKVGELSSELVQILENGLRLAMRLQLNIQTAFLKLPKNAVNPQGQTTPIPT